MTDTREIELMPKYHVTPEGAGWSIGDQTTLYETPERAIAAWNRRPDPSPAKDLDALAKEIEALRAENKRLRDFILEFIAAAETGSIESNPDWISDDLAWLLEHARSALMGAEQTGSDGR